MVLLPLVHHHIGGLEIPITKPNTGKSVHHHIGGLEKC
ncbi:hypothetical protein BSPWISOX_1650 [uncultured Gammaproteobacteria bacterium]|nr:hypothetical protein BSPWISOX_1650 [uncultured Gammaproteobacteria bacterium]